MPFTARQLEPFFERLTSPHQLPNRLQRAVYNGRLHKFQRIIAQTQPADEDNIYRMCDEPLSMSLLYLAVACDQLPMANILMRVYEQDFRALERFHKAQGTGTYEWVGRPVLVACGAERVAEALRLAAPVSRHTDGERMRAEGRAGLVVMCKQSNLDEDPQILWCAPQSDADVPHIARLIDALLAHGCLRFETQPEAWRNAQYLAATRGHHALWLRMQRLYGQHLCDPETYQSQLLQLTALRSGTPVERRAYYAQLEAELGTGCFSVADYLRDATHHQLMQPLLHGEQWDLFEEFVRELAAAMGVTVAESLQANNGENNFFVTLVLCDRLPLAMRAARLFDADLLARGGYEQKPVILYFISGESQTNAAVVEWIVERWPAIEAPLIGDILRAMFAEDWADGLRELYRRFPEQTRGILFAGESAAEQFDEMVYGIERCRFSVVEFALDEHPELFADPELCAKALVNCAYSRRSHPLLLRMLRLPAADVLRPAAQHQDMLPFGAALHFRQLPNFRALWAEIGTDKDRIAAAMRHRDEDGNTLLNEAVWSLKPVADEGPWPYRPEPKIRIEIVDSDDDETEAERKRRFNATEWSLARMDTVVYRPEYYVQQELEYRQVWSMLLAAGGDPHTLTGSGQTLVHQAVAASNVWLLEQLLDLNVAVWQQDAKGRNPLHMCRDARIARLLLDTAEAHQYLNQADNAGQTPLHSLLVQYDERPPHVDVVRLLLEAGADANARNPQTGCTPLHLGVLNADYTRMLLDAGAAVNARDATGCTPAHRIQWTSAELLIRRGEEIDWLAVSDSGVSILSALLSLRAEETDRAAQVLRAHETDIRRLFREHWVAAVDPNGYAATINMCANEYWTREFCAAQPADLSGAKRVRLLKGFTFEECRGEAELLLVDWMRAGGVNFAFLLGERYEDCWSYVSSVLIQRWRGLGVDFNIAENADAVRHALDAERWRGDERVETAEALCMCMAGGADWRRRPTEESGAWMLEKFDIFAVLVEWERLKEERRRKVDEGGESTMAVIADE